MLKSNNKVKCKPEKFGLVSEFLNLDTIYTISSVFSEDNLSAVTLVILTESPTVAFEESFFELVD